MHSIQLWLVHPEKEACDAFSQRFSALDQVSIHQCVFEELPEHDCFVTAGNAYGIMTARIDAAVVNFFGRSIMERVQSQILDRFLGEQPIGTALIVPTEHDKIRWVCHAPTMRTPGSITGTDKVYVATWASLLSVYQHNIVSLADHDQKIRTVCLPAMGTGFGGVSFYECARQMSVAYEHYLNLPHRKPDWDWVILRQKKIHYDNGKRVCQ